MNEHIETLRNKSDNDSYNYLVNYAKGYADAPKPSGCGCKDANRIAFNKQFFSWYDSINQTND